MNKLCFVLVIALMAIPCQGISAEFYRYTDAQGTVRYTDDLSTVPKAQRRSENAIQGSDGRRDQRTAVPEATGQVSAAPDDGTPITAETLNRLREALNRTHADLTAEREILAEQRRHLSDVGYIKE